MNATIQLFLILMVPGGVLVGLIWLARKALQRNPLDYSAINFNAELHRKVFNKLHLELSLLVGEALPRMELWHSVAQRPGVHPDTLTPDQAWHYCVWEARPWLVSLGFDPATFELDAIAEDLLDYDPNQPTPEEVMERLCGGSE